MSKLGMRLINAAKSAQAIAKGEADPKTYLTTITELALRRTLETAGRRVHRRERRGPGVRLRKPAEEKPRK